jgi:hypothetical protein
MAIPTKTYGGTIEGNLDGERIEMDFDLSEEGRAHLISVMTDLYSDEELAPLREYSTNARDAMIDAGRSDYPIEVTTPTDMNPYLTIQDFGIGMNVEDMRNVYSKYGASTKRGSNDVQGMLGLGGKSALTYTSQFTVEAVKDGILTQVIVTRDENGVGVMNVVDQSRTTDRNGVKIVIPAKRYNNFQSKAENFFYYWQPGTVLLNGKQPNHLLDEEKVSKIGDSTYIKDDRWGSNDIVVMGNVAYSLNGRPLSESITDNRYSIVIHYAPMGAVTFAPSREALSYTGKTTAYLDQVQRLLFDQIKKAILGELSTAQTHSQAFEIWSRWVNSVGQGKLPSMSFRGEKFISHKDVRHFGVDIGGGRYNSTTGEYGNRIWEGSRIVLNSLNQPKTLVVVGYTNANKPSYNAGKKVALYLDQNDLDHDNILLFSELPAPPWTDDVEAIEWSEIDAIKLPRNGSASGGKTGTIPVIIYRGGGQKTYYRSDNHKGTWDSITQLDPDEKILYLSPTDIVDEIGRINNVRTLWPEYQIVALGKNRWKKFVRENPEAEKFAQWYHVNFVKDLKAAMTEDELFVADHDSAYRSFAEILSETDDPDFRRLTKPVNKSRIELYNSVIQAPTKSLTKKYPLCDTYGYGGSTNKKHHILYVNAVYNEGN